MLVAGFLMLLAGWVALALASSPLNTALVEPGKRYPGTVHLRRIGGVLVLAGAVPFVAMDGVSQGLVLWAVTLMLSAVAVVLGVTVLLGSTRRRSR